MNGQNYIFWQCIISNVVTIQFAILYYPVAGLAFYRLFPLFAVRLRVLFNDVRFVRHFFLRRLPPIFLGRILRFDAS